MTRKWVEVNDLSNGQYSADKNMRFKNPMRRSDFCDYNDMHIVIKRRIAGKDTAVNNQTNKKVNI